MQVTNKFLILIFFLCIGLAIIVGQFSDSGVLAMRYIDPDKTLTYEFRQCLVGADEESILSCVSERADGLIETYGSEAVAAELRSYEHDFGEDFTCHLMGHTIGKQIYFTELEQAFTSCGLSCHSGCVHGAALGYIEKNGVDAILNLDVAAVCDQQPSSAAYALCLHGIGHAFMLATQYDLQNSLSYCDNLQVESGFATQCHSGVFMELFGAQIRNDHVSDDAISKYEKVDDPLYPCTEQYINDNHTYGRTCYGQRAGSLWEYARNNDTRVFDVCDSAPGDWNYACNFGLGMSMAAHNPEDLPHIIRNCFFANSKELEAECLRGTYVYLDVAADKTYRDNFCTQLPQEKSDVICESF